jgi:hypothetical protein
MVDAVYLVMYPNSITHNTLSSFREAREKDGLAADILKSVVNVGK